MIKVKAIHEDVTVDATPTLTAHDFGKLIRETGHEGEAIAQVLDVICNQFGSSLVRGQMMGKCLATTHPAIQANAIKFLIGALYEMSKSGTDPRNEFEVKLAKQMMAPVMETIEPFISPDEVFRS